VSDVVWGHRAVSVSRTIEAPAADVFAVLRNPALHSVIDGSGTVKGASGDTDQLLELGSRFGMDMKLGVPYRISNEVVEFEIDKRIAWRHMGGYRWCYTIEPNGERSCTVTETFDWSTARLPLLIQVPGMDRTAVPNMQRTLERLDEYLTADR